MDKEIFIKSVGEYLPISKDNIVSILKKNNGIMSKDRLFDKFSGNHTGSLKGVNRNEDMEASVRMWDALSDVAEMEIGKSTSSMWTLDREYLRKNNLVKSSEIGNDTVNESTVVGVICSLGGKSTTETILRNLSEKLTDGDGKVKNHYLDIVFEILDKVALKTQVEHTLVSWRLKIN